MFVTMDLKLGLSLGVAVVLVLVGIVVMAMARNCMGETVCTPNDIAKFKVQITIGSIVLGLGVIIGLITVVVLFRRSSYRSITGGSAIDVATPATAATTSPLGVPRPPSLPQHTSQGTNVDKIPSSLSQVISPLTGYGVSTATSTVVVSGNRSNVVARAIWHSLVDTESISLTGNAKVPRSLFGESILQRMVASSDSLTSSAIRFELRNENQSGYNGASQHSRLMARIEAIPNVMIAPSVCIELCLVVSRTIETDGVTKVIIKSDPLCRPMLSIVGDSTAESQTQCGSRDTPPVMWSSTCGMLNEGFEMHIVIKDKPNSEPSPGFGQDVQVPEVSISVTVNLEMNKILRIVEKGEYIIANAIVKGVSMNILKPLVEKMKDELTHMPIAQNIASATTENLQAFIQQAIYATESLGDVCMTYRKQRSGKD